MPKIDPAKAVVAKGSRYPKPFDEPCAGRTLVLLAAAGGLTQFGVNLTTLAPGAWASQRHWHEKEDEFVYVLTGELALVEDEGETTLRPGDSAAWKAGVRNGHHLVNRTAREATFLIVGTRDMDDWGEYPDIDLKFNSGRYDRKPGTGGTFLHKDGTPY
jgi:uncharacterized cupin superfamily protein